MIPTRVFIPGELVEVYHPKAKVWMPGYSYVRSAGEFHDLIVEREPYRGVKVRARYSQVRSARSIAKLESARTVHKRAAERLAALEAIAVVAEDIVMKGWRDDRLDELDVAVARLRAVS